MGSGRWELEDLGLTGWQDESSLGKVLRFTEELYYSNAFVSEQGLRFCSYRYLCDATPAPLPNLRFCRVVT